MILDFDALFAAPAEPVPVRVGAQYIPRASQDPPAGWLPRGQRVPWWADLRRVSSEDFRVHIEVLIGVRPSRVFLQGASFPLGEDPEALWLAYQEALNMARGYTLLHGTRSYPARWWVNVAANLFGTYQAGRTARGDL